MAAPMNRDAQPFRRAKHVALQALLALALVTVARPATAADAPLADAAEKADWDRVAKLLADHADPNAAQADGATALLWAAYHDHAESARLLLATGADAKAANRYGVTPLSPACTNGDAKLIKMLLAAGADANTTLRGGETALMTASRTGRADAVQALLDAGAKVDATDRSGQTALMWAAADGNAEAALALIKAGANVNARIDSGFTPMLFAAREGRIDVVRTLLKAGADAKDAIRSKRRNGPEPKSGPSALLLAVENGHFELAIALVEAGADPNDERSGYTPLHTLTWVRKPNRGDDPDGQPPPTGSGNLTSLQFARKLVSLGANVNARLAHGPSGKGKLNLTGATPFLMASKTADLPYMQLLVELGADPKLPNDDGATPLMAAAGIGTLAPDEEAGSEDEALAAAEFLLKHGADINVTDRNGETAMHGAAYKSLPKMVHFLADHGAQIETWNRKDKYGWTPLMIAEGFRPGNFKPSAETIDAIERVMRAAGVPPVRTERPLATRPTELPITTIPPSADIKKGR
jgi:ankyrin repeat protein